MEIETSSLWGIRFEDFFVLPQPYITLPVIPRGGGLLKEMLLADDVLNNH